MKLFTMRSAGTLGGLLLLFGCSSGQQITTSYTIVVPSGADSVTRLAATELADYFERINGVRLAIASDDVVSGQGGGEILIGLTNRTDTVGLNVAGLESDGFHIRSNGESVLIVGGSGRGVQYGVYTLLDEYLGCRLYSENVEVVPQSDKIVLPANIDNRQVPVITFRDVYYTNTRSQKYIDWHRQSHGTNGEKPEWGLWVHTFMRLLPPAEHFAKHPEYYALVSGRRATTQPCLSNPAVLEIICENLQKEIDKNPTALYWSVSSDDNFSYCQCEECAAADSVDGSATGSVIQFVNKVAERFPDKIISTLAYQYSRAAPKVTKPAANVNIMFCNIECNRSKSIPSDPTSESFVKDMKDWAALTDNIVVWDYVIQFKNLVSPFPNFHTLQPNLKFLIDNSVVAIFEQGNREVGGEFADLRAYVLSKLVWNPYASTDSLITDFCDGYYGGAGKYVKEYIDVLTAELIASDAPMGIFGSPCDISAQTYLSAENLAKYNAIFDKAEAAVADQPDYLFRTKIARQPLLYAYLEQTKLDPYGANGLYMQDAQGKWVANPRYKETLDTFIDLCRQEGVTRLSEWHTTPDEYYEMMNAVAVVRNEGASFEKPVTISPAPHKRYSNAADKTLTNGIYGTNDYTIQWLGWDEPKVELIMDLGESRKISNITTRYLQNLSDWIFFPLSVTYQTSADGVNFTTAGSVKQPIDKDVAVATREYSLVTDNEARYVRAVIESVGTCPHWHLGAGGRAFVFADEFMVN